MGLPFGNLLVELEVDLLLAVLLLVVLLHATPNLFFCGIGVVTPLWGGVTAALLIQKVLLLPHWGDKTKRNTPVGATTTAPQQTTAPPASAQRHRAAPPAAAPQEPAAPAAAATQQTTAPPASARRHRAATPATAPQEPEAPPAAATQQPAAPLAATSAAFQYKQAVAEKYVQDAWAGRDAHVLLSKIGAYKLFYWDIKRTGPNMELESESINAHLAVLVHNNNRQNTAKAAFIDSFAMTSIWNRGTPRLKVIYPGSKKLIFLDPLGESKKDLQRCLETTRAFM
ncbi:uncharacterized protein LOC120558467 [Perca fluviatilis]|uniref:uncharacterized protein LOC120558467 n=1 Tax=Perca fluviatilis TaxID=8168 RepID=UPI00196324E7|nr:uncharacterized protein LOC120558467 [Perca fluviatilis]